ncbi:hypothetical protein BDW59DRAFT_161899 [Aspergillus cavernicola]|uniref:Restriction endonuclease type IV Mrr domain-containing protein n=1 Tax=Aspergillus cavernicola TaxID=176166 RepID=A0ABR4IBS2_9EURO
MNPTRALLSLCPSLSSITKPPILTPFTRRLFQLPPPPPQPSPSHSDLPSFLTYATRTNLPESTTHYQGTLYEYSIQSHLRSCAFALHRVGGRSDLGIDLTGTWHVGSNPALDAPVRVVVQCKALKTKIGPNVVRELEGVTAASKRRGGGGCAGVLVSPREATKGVREALGRSGMPLVWMMVERGGRVRQVLWNGRVEGLGLAGLGVEVLYPLGSGSDGDQDGDGHGKGVVSLTWEGREVQTMDEVEEEMGRLEEEWMAKWEEKGLRDVSREEVLDAVERVVPGTRPIMISEDEREMVVRSLLAA